VGQGDPSPVLPHTLRAETFASPSPSARWGTGCHPTTRLCLEWLSDVIQGGEHVLDFGCGSGVLAAGALALGASKVTAVLSDHLA